MNAYKPGRPDWTPIAVFLGGVLLAAVALALIILHMCGVTWK